MLNEISAIDILTHLSDKRDKIRDWLKMDYKEGLIKAKDTIDASFQQAKDTINEKMKNHHQELAIILKHLFEKPHLKKLKLNLEQIDVFGLFHELVDKGKISNEEAEVYLDEWSNYVQDQSKSPKLLKRHILMLVALLFIELTPNVGHTEMTQLSENDMGNLSGQTGFSVSMTTKDGQKMTKDVDVSNLYGGLTGIFSSLYEKINKQDLKNCEIDMGDISKELESFEITSPFGSINIEDVKVTGTGNIKIEAHP